MLGPMGRPPLLLALALGAASCVAEPDYTGRLCSAVDPCPSGFVCRAGACAPAGLGPAPDGGLAPDAHDVGPAPDAAPLDAGLADAAPTDAAAPDASPPDAGPAVVALTVEPGSASIAAGRRLTFTARAEDTLGQTFDGSGAATWRVDDPTLLQISAGGAARALAPGATFVEAELDGVVGRAAVSVTPAVPVEVSTFNKHNLALFSDGRVFAWGWNAHGQVDDSGAENVTSPARVDLTDVAYVRAGGVHSVAVREDGTVWAWGSNASGQLGRGTFGGSVSPEPRAVFPPSGVGALTGVDDVACGYDFCLALTSGGELLAWGGNTFGALGQGGSQDLASPLPVPVPGLSGVVEIAAGTYHAVARTSNGAVWTWGYDEYGQLGRGTVGGAGAKDNVPRRVVGVGGAGQLSGVVEIDAGWGHTMARTSDGRIFVWGWAAYRQLGPGVTADAGAPAALQDAAQSPLTGAEQIFAGFAFGLARTPSGDVLAWGNNGYGQLGAGVVTPNRPEPAPVLAAPGGAPFPGVTDLSAGGDHVVAIADDRVWAWGSNVFGELANGSSGMDQRTSTPALVPGL